MKKSQFVYVIVRLIGVSFLAYTVITVLNVSSSLVVLSTTPAGNSFAGPLLLDLVIRALVGLVIGFYLIIDGKLLFSILDRED
jgi:hypothetical protein